MRCLLIIKLTENQFKLFYSKYSQEKYLFFCNDEIKLKIFEKI